MDFYRNSLYQDDHLDSRSIQDRFDSLNDDDDLDDGDKIEKDWLKEIIDQLGDSPEWSYGLALISDEVWVDYAEQLAKDVGNVPSDPSWPLNHIDWNAAAEELQGDYSSITVDGKTYYYLV